jgi:hypothetical protein
MGGGSGGFRVENTDERYDNNMDTSAALTRSDYTPGYDMKGGSAYVGGQSRQQEEQQAYERDAGHTRPQMSRKEEAALASLQEAAFNVGKITPPSQQQQQSEKAQAQQTPQRQTQAEVSSASEQDTRRTPEQAKQAEQQRQFDLSARLRGRVDALEAKGVEQFGQRKDFASERMFNIARESFQQTSQDVSKGRFAAMADRVRAAAAHGNTQEQGQSQSAGTSSTPSVKPHTRFGGMADRASVASQSTQTEASKKDGLEQR